MELIPDLTRPIADEAIEVAPGRNVTRSSSRPSIAVDLPLSTRMRAATAALPHEHPKLAVTTVVNVGDFADQLEKAVERSRRVTHQ